METPGSDGAIKLGCNCPRMDNNYGNGAYGEGIFWINDDCPLHRKYATESQLKNIKFERIDE